MSKINTKDLVHKIEKITTERMSKDKVVELEEFRQLKKPKEIASILIIEDDETMRKSMKRIFEDENYKVITAADGTQLSTVLDDNPIDLIILDVGLPWINGYELAELMRENSDLKHIPIIFVSGRISEADIKAGFEAGADDYVKKPFEVDKIKKSVQTLLKLHHNK